MTANPILLQKKYSRVIECFAKQQGLSLDAALDFFYHSLVYQLIRDGVSDMQAADSFRFINQSVKEQLHRIEHLIIGNTAYNKVIIRQIFSTAAESY